MQAQLKWMAGFSLLVMLAGCAETTPPPRTYPVERHATLTGTVSYPQSITLPPSAIVEVKLVDATAVGAGAATVAEHRFEPTGQAPFSFSLTYDPSRLQENQRYAVQARILVDGKPWMVTGTVNHLMEGGRIAHAEIILQSATAPAR